MKKSHRILQAILVLYAVSLLYLLYSLRFTILALFLNPQSLASFIIGILLFTFLISAVFVGISYLKKQSFIKLIYVASAVLYVATSLAYHFFGNPA